MSTDYPLGTVAEAMVGTEGRRVTRFDTGWADITDPDAFWLDRHSEVTDVRPLVVLDPENADQMRDLVATLGSLNYYGSPWMLAAALREYARSRPKPEEPTGYLAIVEDRERELWIRDDTSRGLVNPWRRIRMENERRVQLLRGYEQIDAVKVLSEGVTR